MRRLVWAWARTAWPRTTSNGSSRPWTTRSVRCLALYASAVLTGCAQAAWACQAAGRHAGHLLVALPAWEGPQRVGLLEDRHVALCRLSVEGHQSHAAHRSEGQQWAPLAAELRRKSSVS